MALIVLPDNKRMKSLGEGGDGYKYLGVLEADDVRHMDVQVTVQKEYFCRIRKILKSKLNGSSIIQAINSRAVSLLRYGAGLTGIRIRCAKWTGRPENYLLSFALYTPRGV